MMNGVHAKGGGDWYGVNVRGRITSDLRDRDRCRRVPDRHAREPAVGVLALGAGPAAMPRMLVEPMQDPSRITGSACSFCSRAGHHRGAVLKSFEDLNGTPAIRTGSTFRVAHYPIVVSATNRSVGFSGDHRWLRPTLNGLRQHAGCSGLARRPPPFPCAEAARPLPRDWVSVRFDAPRLNSRSTQGQLRLPMSAVRITVHTAGWMAGSRVGRRRTDVTRLRSNHIQVTLRHMSTVEVFADVLCPSPMWAHPGDRRTERGLEEPRLRIRA